MGYILPFEYSFVTGNILVYCGIYELTQYITLHVVPWKHFQQLLIVIGYSHEQITV